MATGLRQQDCGDAVVCHGASAGAQLRQPGVSPYGLAGCCAGGRRACARLSGIASTGTHRSALPGPRKIHFGSPISIYALNYNRYKILDSVCGKMSPITTFLREYLRWKWDRAHPMGGAYYVADHGLRLGPRSSTGMSGSPKTLGRNYACGHSMAAFFDFRNVFTGVAKFHL